MADRIVQLDRTGLSGEQLQAVETLEKTFSIPLLDDDNPESIPCQIKNVNRRIDSIEAGYAKQPIGTNDKSLAGQIASAINKNHQSILDVREGRTQKAIFKALPMLTSTHATTPVVSGGKFTIDNGATVHARDVVPFVPSETSTWIDYVEGAITGEPAFQVEGTTKAGIEFTYQTKQVKAEYLAGWTRFSKQLANNLPFLRSVLSQQLIREFLKAEDKFIIDALTTQATGYTSEDTDDIAAIIDTIAGRLTAGYETDVVLMNHIQYSRLLKAMYTTGNYFGSGSVVGTPGGGISIWSTPIVPVAWVANGKGLFIDRSFVNRIVVEPMNIQFSEHDGDNFVKNLITARIEEMEAISVLKPASLSYLDFGNE